MLRVAILFLLVLWACKRPSREEVVVWEGSSLVCSEYHQPKQDDVYTCVGSGRVYTCIRNWRGGGWRYDCATAAPPPNAEQPDGR